MGDSDSNHKMPDPQAGRRHELDWLRVIAFFILIVFHAGFPFCADIDGGIRNNVVSGTMSKIWDFLHFWRIPLLFLISGAGVWYAFGERSIIEFFKERFRRLVIPLVFGVLFITPITVYYYLSILGANDSSFFQFYKKTLSRYFVNGEFYLYLSHLWFIAYLFLYCVTALPVFLFIRSESGKHWLDKLAAFFDKTLFMYVFSVPICLGVFLLIPYYKSFELDWARMYLSFFLLIMGFILASRRVYLEVLERQRIISLLIGLGGWLLMKWFKPEWDSSVYGWNYEPSLAYEALRSITLLGILYAIIGFAKHYLEFSNAFLEYTNSYIYPFYILHAPFWMMASYYLLPLDINMWVKLALVIMVTVLPTVLVCHFLIRPWDHLRLFFGLKKRGFVKADHRKSKSYSKAC
ncbi:MAG: acyltransferase [Exilibacterium sp.]